MNQVDRERGRRITKVKINIYYQKKNHERQIQKKLSVAMIRATQGESLILAHSSVQSITVGKPKHSGSLSPVIFNQEQGTVMLLFSWL